MNSFQESKNELEAAIRYAENAISSAQGTIESMEFRQEMAKKQYAEQTGREEALTKQVQELESKVQGQYDDIVMLEREVEVYTKKYNELAQGKGVPTMPVIPKAVAIAIFREGVAHGVSRACDELDNDAGITIEETGYTGDFEVSFNRWIDLSEHLDLDWMRDKVGDYDEASVIEALKFLCADKEFECRIHGVDDQQTKDND
jgi:hypothetical protein